MITKEKPDSKEVEVIVIRAIGMGGGRRAVHGEKIKLSKVNAIRFDNMNKVCKDKKDPRFVVESARQKQIAAEKERVSGSVSGSVSGE